MNQVLEVLRPPFATASVETWQFMEGLARTAPSVSSVDSLTGAIGINPFRLMSRFFRAGIPTPKRYLAATRLLYVAAYFEHSEVTVAAVADRP